MAKVQTAVTTKRQWTPPNYPYMGGGAVSAKVVNRAEVDGTFAIEVAFAVIAHRENGRKVSFRKTSAGTLVTATIDGIPLTILGDESEHFPCMRSRGQKAGLQ